MCGDEEALTIFAPFNPPGLILRRVQQHPVGNLYQGGRCEVGAERVITGDEWLAANVENVRADDIAQESCHRAHIVDGRRAPLPRQPDERHFHMTMGQALRLGLVMGPGRSKNPLLDKESIADGNEAGRNREGDSGRPVFINKTFDDLSCDNLV
jgi:hypothetical protein